MNELKLLYANAGKNPLALRTVASLLFRGRTASASGPDGIGSIVHALDRENPDIAFFAQLNEEALDALPENTRGYTWDRSLVANDRHIGVAVRNHLAPDAKVSSAYVGEDFHAPGCKPQPYLQVSLGELAAFAFKGTALQNTGARAAQLRDLGQVALQADESKVIVGGPLNLEPNRFLTSFYEHLPLWGGVNDRDTYEHLINLGFIDAMKESGIVQPVIPTPPKSRDYVFAASAGGIPGASEAGISPESRDGMLTRGFSYTPRVTPGRVPGLLNAVYSVHVPLN